MFDRWFAAALQKKLARPYVHLIFGARQTGKSTLIERLREVSEMLFADAALRCQSGTFAQRVAELSAWQQSMQHFPDSLFRS
jgi:hypothetical protein